jgi:DNA-binding GntR family transcriptional regulator
MAELLRQGIRENVLSPGQQLVQDDLAKRFGVSRNPVREALRMLAAEGLVTIAAGDGAVVPVHRRPR